MRPQTGLHPSRRRCAAAQDEDQKALTQQIHIGYCCGPVSIVISRERYHQVRAAIRLTVISASGRRTGYAMLVILVAVVVAKILQECFLFET
jgi:hypothetical protein